MRSIIKMLGLAFMATLAFSMVGALGAGSASALLFLTTGAASESFTVENLGKPKLETLKGRTVECESVDGSGTILNKSDVTNKILFTFHKCSASFEPTCTSPGQPAGLIKTLELDGLLVSLLGTTEHKYGIELLPEKGTSTDFTEFTCTNGIANVKTVVVGSVVGEFTETQAQSQTSKTAAKILFAKGANTGEQAIKDYETLQGVKTAKLESTLSGAINEANEESNEQAEGDIKTTNGITLCHK